MGKFCSTLFSLVGVGSIAGVACWLLVFGYNTTWFLCDKAFDLSIDACIYVWDKIV